MDGGTVYVGAGGRVYAFGTDGHTRWQFDTEYQTAGISDISNQTLYVGTGEQSLYAVDVADGNQRWVFRSGGQGWLNSPTVVDNHLYVGSGDSVGSGNRVYAVALSDP